MCETLVHVYFNPKLIPRDNQKSEVALTDSDLVCRYCAGTMPWGNPGDHHDFEPQRHDDGYIEVIGFTMASLVSTNSILLKTFVCKPQIILTAHKQNLSFLPAESC